MYPDSQNTHTSWYLWSLFTVYLLALFHCIWPFFSLYLRPLSHRIWPLVHTAPGAFSPLTFFISAVAGAGDIAAQLITNTSCPKPFLDQWDRRRTLGIVTFGAVYSGWFQHYLFAGYAKLFPVANVSNSVRYANALKLTFCHQFGSFPCFYFPSFFMIVETVRGMTVPEAWENFKLKFWKQYKYGLVVWTPAMLTQFLWVPLPLQVPYIASIAAVWVTYLSYVAL